MNAAGPPEREPDARHHPGERHGAGFGSRLNWLRAGVLGANDGIVSVAGLVVGVAGVTTERGPLFTAGIAGLVAGAVSMALGEYVSVSSQRDSEKAQLDTEKRELRDDTELELAELAALYEAKGLRPETARTVAHELTEHDALAAHLDAELSIDPEDLTSPWQAAGASALAFTLGAVLPLLAILLPPPAWRVPACVAVVLVALVIAGWVGAILGGGSRAVAVARVVIGGALAWPSPTSSGTSSAPPSADPNPWTTPDPRSSVCRLAQDLAQFAAARRTALRLPSAAGLSAAGARHLRLGVGVTEPIRRHPVLIAQTMLTVAQMTKKAPILGIGAGERMHIDPYGLDFLPPRRAPQGGPTDHPPLLRRVGPINFEGHHFTLDNALMDLHG